MLQTCEPVRHLYVAVPAYTAQVAATTAHSLIESISALRSAGVEVTPDFFCGCCYLDQTRNILADSFLNSEATDLLFVDADVGFTLDAMLRIALAPRPLVAGLYPKKTDEVSFPVLFDADSLRSDADGLVEAAMVATGFLRINRGVFDALRDDAPEYLSDDGKLRRAYFRCGVRCAAGAGRYWGEDVLFCEDWRAKGGKVHVIPDLTFEHVGLKAWRGNWAAWMKATREGVTYEVPVGVVAAAIAAAV